VKVTPLELPEVLLVDLRVFGDARGWFAETWQAERYAEAGIPSGFVQDNAAYSQRGVLRGLHAQHPYDQGKLIQVLRGEIYDVAVDIRRGSPTFGRWVGIPLSAARPQQGRHPAERGDAAAGVDPAGLCAWLLRAQRRSPVHLQVHRLLSPGDAVQRPLGRSGDRRRVAARDRAGPGR